MAEAVAGEAEARRHRPVLVVAGASLGTLFEWYDFFLYGALAAHIARHFFTGVSDATAFIFALGAFAAGFIARPFGAIVFGRIGDVVGRKNTFLATMLIMGLSTFLVGLLPGRDAIGVAAPILLVFLRILQGLAVGGEYGGAAIYVAEHAPRDRRAFHTSWINMMATGGLILSLLVVAAFRSALPQAEFQDWGWRLPFLLSALLLGISLWIRLKLGESPVYEKMKEEASLSSAPLSEAFGRWSNLKLILIALCAVAGSTVIWYGSQFYAMFFLQRVLKVDELTVSLIMVGALVLAALSYLVFGWLSDRVGRKPVIVAGLTLGAVAMFPGFQLITQAANPQLAAAQRTAPVVVHADPATCSVQFDPVGGRTYDATGCDIAKAHLSREGVSYRSRDLPAGAATQVHVGGTVITVADPSAAAEGREAAVGAFRGQATAALSAAGYPRKADPQRVNHLLVIAVIAFLAMCAAATYAPIAAFMVELFPARIRYTSLSFPYHLASGWVGGLLPATAFAIVATTGDIYSGLWYPVFFSGLATLVCLFLLPETRGRPID
jgi:MFS family permease